MDSEDAARDMLPAKYFIRGLILAHDHDYVEALKNYAAAAREEDRHVRAMAFYGKGRVLLELGDYRRGLAAFRGAVEDASPASASSIREYLAPALGFVIVWEYARHWGSQTAAKDAVDLLGSGKVCNLANGTCARAKSLQTTTIQALFKLTFDQVKDKLCERELAALVPQGAGVRTELRKDARYDTTKRNGVRVTGTGATVDSRDVLKGLEDEAAGAGSPLAPAATPAPAPTGAPAEAAELAAAFERSFKREKRAWAPPVPPAYTERDLRRLIGEEELFGVALDPAALPEPHQIDRPDQLFVVPLRLLQPVEQLELRVIPTGGGAPFTWVLPDPPANRWLVLNVPLGTTLDRQNDPFCRVKQDQPAVARLEILVARSLTGQERAFEIDELVVSQAYNYDVVRAAPEDDLSAIKPDAPAQ